MISNTWRDFKSKLSGRILEASQGPNMTRHIALLKPAEVKMNEWEEFVKGRLSSEFKVIRDKHKEARAKQMYPHTTSRKGYARLSEDMKVVKKVKAVPRVDVWVQGHTKKDGEPVNDATKETMAKNLSWPISVTKGLVVFTLRSAVFTLMSAMMDIATVFTLMSWIL